MEYARDTTLSCEHEDLRGVQIDATSAGGRYCDVLRACEILAPRFGSRVNALAQMVRASKLFREAMKAGKGAAK